MNNGLVKEYFRAIKEIKPKAFVMENVSMLRSDTHRFYESTKDNQEIEAFQSHKLQYRKYQIEAWKRGCYQCSGILVQ